MAVLTILPTSFLITIFLLVFALNRGLCEQHQSTSQNLELFPKNCSCFRHKHSNTSCSLARCSIYILLFLCVQSLKEQWRCSVPVVVNAPHIWKLVPRLTVTQRRTCTNSSLLALDHLLFFFFFFFRHRFPAFGCNPWGERSGDWRCSAGCVFHFVSPYDHKGVFSYTVKYNMLMAPWNVCVCVCICVPEHMILSGVI